MKSARIHLPSLKDELVPASQASTSSILATLKANLPFAIPIDIQSTHYSTELNERCNARPQQCRYGCSRHESSAGYGLSA